MKNYCASDDCPHIREAPEIEIRQNPEENACENRERETRAFPEMKEAKERGNRRNEAPSRMHHTGKNVEEYDEVENSDSK